MVSAQQTTLPAQERSSSGRVPQLDILRTVAILLVMGRHPAVPATSAGVWAPVAQTWYRFGWSGVDLFFVLSGFLIGGLLFQEIKQRGSLDVRRFIVRRGLKIWPAYYCLLAFAALVVLATRLVTTHAPALLARVPALQAVIAKHPEYVSFQGLLPSVLHVQNYLGVIRLHTWSLAVEEHFYLLLPLLLWLLVRRGGSVDQRLRLVPWIALTVVTACTVMRFVPSAQVDSGPWPIFYQTHLRADGLFFGVLLAYLYHLRPDLTERLVRNRSLLAAGGLALVAPIAFLDPARSIGFVATIGFTMLYVGYGALLLAFLHTPPGTGLVGGWLTGRLARSVAFVGAYSYSIYLWHIDLGRVPVSILSTFARRLPPSASWPLCMGLYVLLACAAGIVMGKLIEMPVLRLRDRWFPPRAGALGSADVGSAVVRQAAEGRSGGTRPSLPSAQGMGRRIVANTAVAAGCRLLTLTVGLFVTPVVIGMLGMAGLGVWEVIGAIRGWAFVADAAVGSAVQRYMGHAYGREDARTMGRYAGISLSAGLLFFVVLCPTVYLLRYPLLAALHVPPTMLRTAAVALPLCLVLASLSVIGSTPARVVASAQRSGICDTIDAVTTVLSSLSIIVCLLGGLGFYSLVVGQAVQGLGSGLAALVVARRLCPAVALYPVVPTRAEMSELYGYGSRIIVARVAEMLGKQTDKLVLAALATPTLVGYYAIATRIATFVTEFSGFVFNPIVPTAAALEGRGDHAGLRRLYSLATSASSLATGMGVVLFIGLHDRLEVLWLHRYFPQTTGVVFGMGLAYALNMVIVPGFAVCRGTGRVGIEARYTCLYLLLNVVATIGFVRAIGPLGTAVATMVSLAVASIYYLWALHRSTDMPVSSSLAALRVTLAAATVALGVHWLSQRFGMPVSRPEAAAAWLLLGAVGCAGFVAAAFAVRGATREQVRAVWTTVTSRRRPAEVQAG